MSMFFVVHRLPDGEPECKHFKNAEGLFMWFMGFYINDGWPDGLMIYQAECIFDGN